MPKLNVFVACPYTLFPYEDYKKVFQSVSRSYDVSFKFADEQITNQHVLGKITNYIRDHDFSLFDITGWNPNVALELGIAVGLGKKYFILFNHRWEPGKYAPSDIKGIDRVQYGSNSELEAKLIFLLKQEMPTEKNSSDSAFASVKTKIAEVLTEEPGIGLSKIADAVSEDKTLVQSVLRAMVTSAELKTRGAKKGTKYFTADTDLRSFR